MASLNTLRTKFGFVLSIIIALALLAFILSLKTDMGFSGSDPKVGVIDGEKITYSEYLEVYNNVKAQSNASESNEEQLDQLADMAWQTLISQRVFLPGFESMGIQVTDAERSGLISGEYLSPVLASVFTNPRTGQYDLEYLSNFLAQAAQNPEAQYMWSTLIERAMDERMATKFGSLVNAGVFANDLEVAEGVQIGNKTFSGVWTGRRYSDMPDSLYAVSDADVKAYYNSHKNKYKQQPSRAISYVVFEVAPSEEDKTTLEQTVREVGAEFAASDDPKAFVRNNRFGKIANNFIAPGQFPEDQGKVLAADQQYGPVLNNDSWMMSRVVESKMTPDTVGLRHIVLPFAQDKLADSLIAVLRQGADFAHLAQEYSLYAETSGKGGDAGVMPFSAFPDDLSVPLSTATQGEILKVVSGDVIQIIQPYRLDRPSKHMRVATITYPVEASSATRRGIHSQASLFSVNGTGSVENFNNAADNDALTPRVATLKQGERTLQGLDKSRELVRWAYDAEVGEISEIFTIGNDYVVAMVTEIDDNTYTPLKRVEEDIRKILIRDKKYEEVVDQLKGNTIEEIAANLGTEVTPFENVRYGAFFVRDLGIEPRVIGTIVATEQPNTLSKPVKGDVGAYVFVVTNIVEGDVPQTAQAEKVRVEAATQGMIQRRLSEFLGQMSNIEDLRGKYF